MALAEKQELKKGMRLLVQEGPDLKEVEVWEISPSGKYVLLLTKNSTRIWVTVTYALAIAVEVLA